MFGKATLEIPQDGPIGPSKFDELSDELALSYGRLAAATLSDDNDGLVKVTLKSGRVHFIGPNLE